MPPPRSPETTVTVTPTHPPPTPSPASTRRPDLDPSLVALNGVLAVTSLNSNAGQPARLTNLTQSNIVANVNRSAQNAVSNQQAHSQLALTVLGKAVNNVQNLGPLETRASLDALTQNTLAQELADLSAVIAALGGGGIGPAPAPRWPAIIRALLQLAREIDRIIAGNARLTGNGTYEDPYVVASGSRFYVKAPITLAFYGAATVNFQTDPRGALGVQTKI